MDWLLLATGATGAWTLLFVARSIERLLRAPAAHAVHFSPKGGCTDVVVAELKRARHEVLVLAYSFTSQPIAQALVDAKLRGARVEIVLDHSNENETHTDLPFFLAQGLTPLIDPHHAIAHNKVMVIDGHTVITGSFNFTNQAEHENAENLLVLKHYPDLARAYRENFVAHKEHARAPQSRPAAAAPHEHGATHKAA
ncbi:MAG: phospholipase D family protein [Planctomycetes bacterium]|nr:phospholipase D family protein [Planctomycetota bacterium]